MTSGRLVVLAILLVTILFGIGVWYASTRAYYTRLASVEVSLQRPDGTLVPLEIGAAQGIDADTSPLRFRACFLLEPPRVPDLLATAMPYPEATPLTGPGWFDCYDAGAVGADLEAGRATAVLGQRNISRGIDRVLAVYPDGRAYAWHQLNGSLE